MLYICMYMFQPCRVTHWSKCHFYVHVPAYRIFNIWVCVDIQYTPMKYHYGGVIMSAMASQIIGVSIVCSAVCSCENTEATRHYPLKGHRSPVGFLHKGPVTRKIFPFDDVIICKWFCFSSFGFVSEAVVSGLLSIIYSFSPRLLRWYKSNHIIT